MSPKGVVCLFGSLILSRHPFADKRRRGSEWRPALGLCSTVSYPSPVQLVRAGGAQDDQTFQNDPTSMAPCSFYVSAQFTLPASSSLPDPHLPHLSQTPWITPLLSSFTLNKDSSMRAAFSFSLCENFVIWLWITADGSYARRFEFAFKCRDPDSEYLLQGEVVVL